MKTSSTLRTALFALATIITLSQPAKAVEYSSYKLNGTPTVAKPWDSNAKNNIWYNGIITQLEPMKMDAKGGSMYFSVNAPGDKYSPRRYRVTWTFEQDITTAYIEKPFSVRLAIQGEGLAAASDCDPSILVCGRVNADGPGQLDEAHQVFNMKDKRTNPSSTRGICGPYHPGQSNYSFDLWLNGFARGDGIDPRLVITYNYTGIQTTTPPVATSPMANTPAWFYVNASGSYYTFTKSGNAIIEGLWNTTSKWTLNYVTQGYLNNNHGIVVQQAGAAYSLFIPDKGSSGINPSWMLYKMNNSTSWYYFQQMIGVQ